MGLLPSALVLDLTCYSKGCHNATSCITPICYRVYHPTVVKTVPQCASLICFNVTSFYVEPPPTAVETVLQCESPGSQHVSSLYVELVPTVVGSILQYDSQGCNNVFSFYVAPPPTVTVPPTVAETVLRCESPGRYLMSSFHV